MITGILKANRYFSRLRHKAPAKQKAWSTNWLQALPGGAGEGTRTPTVSLLILSQARLPFRHTGITELL